MASSFAGSSLISGSNVSVDEQTVLEQEQQFELEYEREQKGVLAFRALLMKCIRVHAHSFHSKAERTSSKSNSDAYTSVVIPLGVDHYVPVPTARALYSEVIKMVDKEGSNNFVSKYFYRETGGCGDNNFDKRQGRHFQTLSGYDRQGINTDSYEGLQNKSQAVE